MEKQSVDLTDHDVLIEVRADVKNLTSNVAQYMATTTHTLTNHEHRITVLEKDNEKEKAVIITKTNQKDKVKNYIITFLTIITGLAVAYGTLKGAGAIK